MYPEKFARPSAGIGAASVFAMAVAGASPGWAAPVTRVATIEQCPISLQANAAPARRNESILGALAGGVLTSVADSLLDAGFAFIKTKLDPSKNEFNGHAILPHPGMFAVDKHNSNLTCIAVAVFDSEQSVPFALPRNTAVAGDRPPFPMFRGTSPAVRFQKAFPNTSGNPTLYFEAVRTFSPDGKGHYYKPVYAYVARMISPHFLSKDPVWEVDINLKNLAGEPVGAWAFKVSGDTPLERGEDDLQSLVNGWTTLLNPPAAAPAPALPPPAIGTPFTIEAEVKEHRTANLFSTALQKATTDNEAAAKQIIRDAYPWRKTEVTGAAAVAEAKAKDEARTKLLTYLENLETYETDCASPTTMVQKTRCTVKRAKLEGEKDSMAADITKYNLLNSGTLPSPTK